MYIYICRCLSLSSYTWIYTQISYPAIELLKMLENKMVDTSLNCLVNYLIFFDYRIILEHELEL